MSKLPQTLVFQKKGIQTFPNKQKVVLYYCDAIKQYYPFVVKDIKEEESIINKLKHINEVEEINFDNGLSLNINRVCSEYILKLYDEIDDKESFERYITESEQNFLNMLEYSVENIK